MIIAYAEMAAGVFLLLLYVFAYRRKKKKKPNGILYLTNSFSDNIM